MGCEQNKYKGTAMHIILGGGGSGEQTTDSNKLFESLIDPTKPILYIPLAMEPYRYDDCMVWINGEFSNIKHGEFVMVRSADEIRDHKLTDFAAIFIGGGNTYRLLDCLKDSGAFEQIQEYLDNGGVVYGGSAGAIIFGKDIDACLYMDTNDVDLGNTIGFNALFGCSMTAHYTNQNPAMTELATTFLNQYSHREPVVALPEEDALYTDGNIVMVVGSRPWYIFDGGTVKQFEPNAKYTKDEFMSIIKI